MLKSHIMTLTGSDVGKRIFAARRAAGLTQADLASRVGLDRTVLSKIESGRRRVGVHEIGAFATALGRAADWFLTRDADGPDLARLKRMRRRILAVASKHGATNVRVFGSVVRGDGDAQSDVDLLVDMPSDHSLFDRAALIVDLTELLGCDVDVATPQALRERMRDRVLREAVAL